MATIGHILKTERTKKKISLDEIYVKTKISPKVIALIEEDKLDELPNPSYSKYFIRTYAKFLGLNPQEIALKLEPVSKKGDSNKKSELYTKKIDQVKPAKKDVPNPIAFDSEFKKAFLKILVVLVILVGFTFTVILIKNASNKIMQKRKENMQLAQLKKNAAQSRETKEVTRKTTNSTEQILSIPENEDISLVLKASEPVWAKVTVDDKVIYQNELKRSSEEAWNAKEKIELKIGKPESVEFYVNNEPINLSRIGQNIIITRNLFKVISK